MGTNENMNDWPSLLKSVMDEIEQHDILFFRGQSDARWPLIPSLGRTKTSNVEHMESVLFYDFVSYAGPLLTEELNSWKTIFLMQHHGIPTRLLDWTGSFGIALYFAIKNAESDAVVWLLDPFVLNESTINNNSLLTVTDLGHSYEELFVNPTTASQRYLASAVAIAPHRQHPRLFHQGGYFTLHREMKMGLETICPKALTKFVIPKELFPDAQNFLKLSGINEFSLFPDLDGLSRHLLSLHL